MSYNALLQGESASIDEDAHRLVCVSACMDAFAGFDFEAERVLYAKLASPHARIRELTLAVFDAARDLVVDDTDCVANGPTHHPQEFAAAVAATVARLRGPAPDMEIETRMVETLALEIQVGDRPSINVDVNAVWVETGAHELWCSGAGVAADVLDVLALQAVGEAVDSSLATTLNDPRWWNRASRDCCREKLDSALSWIGASTDPIPGVDLSRGLDQAHEFLQKHAEVPYAGLEDFKAACGE